MKKEELLGLYDDATESARKVISAIPFYMIHMSFRHMFGPGELVFHLVQADKFNQGWICGQVRGDSFQIPCVFDRLPEDPTKRRRQLGRINLRGAQEACMRFRRKEKHAGPDDLCARWTSNREETRKALATLPSTTYGRKVSHPLVELSGPLYRAINQLFIVHTAYHTGQITQILKTNGCADDVPFIISEFAA